jgi:hypothetical protein
MFVRGRVTQFIGSEAGVTRASDSAGEAQGLLSKTVWIGGVKSGDGEPFVCLHASSGPQSRLKSSRRNEGVDLWISATQRGGFCTLPASPRMKLVQSRNVIHGHDSKRAPQDLPSQHEQFGTPQVESGNG